MRHGRIAVSMALFPPPDMTVIAHTRIVRGAAAARRGWMMQAGGMLICVVAVGIPIAFCCVVQSIDPGVSATAAF